MKKVRDEIRDNIVYDIFPQIESSFCREIIGKLASEIRHDILGQVGSCIRIHKGQLKELFNEH